MSRPRSHSRHFYVPSVEFGQQNSLAYMEAGYLVKMRGLCWGYMQRGGEGCSASKLVAAKAASQEEQMVQEGAGEKPACGNRVGIAE